MSYRSVYTSPAWQLTAVAALLVRNHWLPEFKTLLRLVRLSLILQRDEVWTMLWDLEGAGRICRWICWSYGISDRLIRNSIRNFFVVALAALACFSCIDCFCALSLSSKWLCLLWVAKILRCSQGLMGFVALRASNEKYPGLSSFARKETKGRHLARPSYLQSSSIDFSSSP